MEDEQQSDREDRQNFAWMLIALFAFPCLAGFALQGLLANPQPGDGWGFYEVLGFWVAGILCAGYAIGRFIIRNAK